jgi:hypothetical protein
MTTKPKLLDQVRQALRLKHYSYETEKAYVHWTKRYIIFHQKRHPAVSGAIPHSAIRIPQFNWAGWTWPGLKSRNGCRLC